MNYLALLRRYGLLAICVSLVPVLSGCILLPIAVVGALGVKGVQALSKSTYSVHLDDPTVENTNALVAVNSIALWPEAKGQASSFYQGNALVSNPDLAEQLSKSGSMEVISPLTVSQVLQTNALPQSFQDMMPQDKRHVCTVVADATGADAVLCSYPADMKDDSRFFTFKRAAMTFASEVQLYSRTNGNVLWQDKVIVIVKKGSTIPSDTEIQKAVAENLAKRLLEITGKTPPTITTTNAPVAFKTP